MGLVIPERYKNIKQKKKKSSRNINFSTAAKLRQTFLFIYREIKQVLMLFYVFK